MDNSSIKQEPSTEFILILPPFNSALNAARIKTERDGYKFKCEKCEMKFRTQPDCRKHTLRVHCEKVKCEICLKLFSKTSIAGHKKVHNKKFECDYCGHKFAERKILVSHVMFHTNPDAFKCHICERKNKTKTLLVLHLRSAHGLQKITEKCSKCLFTSTDRKTMNLHRAQHNGQFCKECNKTFIGKEDFQQHMKIHANSKDLKCNHCGLKCVNFAGMSAHLRQHKENPDLTRECKICLKVLPTLKKLKNHVQLVHESKF
jgi:KRAB domain-containing zinc finger protein